MKNLNYLFGPLRKANRMRAKMGFVMRHDSGAFNRLYMPPTHTELLRYGSQVQAELDSFLMGHAYHEVSILVLRDAVQCAFEMKKEEVPIPDCVQSEDIAVGTFLSDTSDEVKQFYSANFATQYGLRIYDGPVVFIIKRPFLIHWTEIQGIKDAGEIIAEAIDQGFCVSG